ncbi:Fe2+-dependent dioxygenase [Novacetimonas hansenii]|uniref:Fe2+-dependent dioxygenase n=2 Tax=Novacetimonas hansenii TaxID=436 RepID=A0AAW5EPT8_NOVHA|nr:Fe2+-dependent dioxygenase [Novacetimonas hansenii]EFG85449.1 2OG-Fe(II) oxygenase [Novacetimonas hansenii ATCC 23769]MBL7237810.1 Fe2+-dependent dioxygenase [Novacetimonas hansenii]MCJ8353792.1 Fe2+-dependent dioxygenase [Novacetimonas hansenii]PYD72505.1 PKHD-type hydroxylase [Novacetimonas hansenii]QOF94896.1 Fe2+-dependent dioxygenase [Novacetimonas hansenii]
MLLHVPGLLDAGELAHCQATLRAAQWTDGRETAGQQSAKSKNNRQLPQDSPACRELGDIVLRALGRNATFNSAVLPYRVSPPLFNRYDVGMSFGAHVDNAIRGIYAGGIHTRIRTDVSTTLFLSDPDDYDGGELIMSDPGGEQAIKLPAGDLVLYSTTVLHRVTPVTRGSRLAAFFWSQSMVADETRRRILFDLDVQTITLRERLGDHDPAVLGLTNIYHNLMRQWCIL